MLVVTYLSGLSFSVGPAALPQPAPPGSPGCSASHSAAGRHGAATLAAHSEASSADGWRGGSGQRWLLQPAQSAAQSAAALLASAALLLGSASPGYAENELADLAQGQFKSELIDPQCFAKSCKLQTKACAENGDCMKGLTCAAKCMGDTQCTVGCFAKFGNPVLDDVLSCTIEDQSCLKIAIVAPGADGPLDAPLPPKPLVAVTPQQMAGKWYKVMGWNSNYDCYDCQRNSFRPAARQQAMAIAADGSAVDVDVEYSLPRQRAGMPQDFHAQLHEKLVFDTTPGSHRTAHTEGKMFGLTFWENWYVIGANDRGEDAFRIVYYTGKTLQNKYEGAFVYARKPDLPASAMPHIYSIARQAGLEPTSFCAIDNRCYAAPAATAGETPQPPPFTNVAAADTIELDEAPLSAPATPPPRMGVLRDAQEFLEDPRPFGRAIFEKQKKMSEIREFDADGRSLPSENFRSSGSR
ncbi:violaxanthin de-epoxidase [Emiliania huxleyi CCMP1516]|uniref:VDE lipocalin domain-containing protein n=2 Tax=Emiliania huxleyi TaxID=2903 RepID=A0A0D3KU04_EMIH1|nr:Violaxanthin deepoxidase [Emiliania huxleyi CCMP1516]XP_005791668.1 violaxanthin de-epoxidase [Emiliania huxleyi CCMP1516]EOD12371.1 Violaxanthin deepoxidase [Emiliania huxleyi CCMP1516]EOD39239.1 violaxanthin de-epoxidase [Emiliania huxleyi CCMP1516]|eukprot:XP_005764800.1 Violaxanthin deepoxidase [Emiliania huxleyi CCMP1516]